VGLRPCGDWVVDHLLRAPANLPREQCAGRDPAHCAHASSSSISNTRVVLLCRKYAASCEALREWEGGVVCKHAQLVSVHTPLPTATPAFAPYLPRAGYLLA